MCVCDTEQYSLCNIYVYGRIMFTGFPKISELPQKQLIQIKKIALFYAKIYMSPCIRICIYDIFKHTHTCMRECVKSSFFSSVEMAFYKEERRGFLVCAAGVYQHTFALCKSVSPWIKTQGNFSILSDRTNVVDEHKSIALVVCTFNQLNR